MPAPFWFLIGVCTTLAVGLLIAAIKRRGAPATRGDATPRGAAVIGPEPGDVVELRLARRVLDETARDIESLAVGLGDELATMASAIEGHAQLLCEAMGEPRLVVRRGEHLWSSVRRLRMFSEKILAFSRVDALPLTPFEARPFLHGIAQEIEDTGNRLSVHVATSECLPTVLANERALRNAMMFLIDALLRIENRASRLELRAHAQVFDDQDTRVEFAICAETDESGPPHEPTDHAVHLGYIAARNLLQAQGVRLSFDEVEGLSVACYLSLPTVPRDASSADLERTPIRPAAEPHEFGGVLILESDPEIRALLAQELKPLGRKMVSCVDGASARSLIDATPERFELAILNVDARIENGHAIARLAAERIPGIRILLLSNSPIDVTEIGPSSPARVIAKPFGVPELREALTELLAVAETPHDGG